MGQVDFSKKYVADFRHVKHMVSDIISEVNKTDGKYAFDITVVQSAYACIQPWCIAYDVPKSMTDQDVVLNITYIER